MIADLWAAGRLEHYEWVDGFQERLRGRNGGGDRYVTDGRLAVGVLASRADRP